MPYTVFKEQVASGNVKAIYSQGASIEGRFAARVTWPPAGADGAAAGPGLPTRPQPRTATTFTTTLPAFVDPGLETLPDRPQGRDQRGADPAAAAAGRRCCSASARRSCIIAFYVWLYRRAAQGGGMGGALMGIGKSKARRYDQEAGTKVTFDDVAGIDEAENELVEIVDFLKAPEKYTRLGGTRAEGRAAGRRAGHRQDAAREGGRRRSRACRSSR